MTLQELNAARKKAVKVAWDKSQELHTVAVHELEDAVRDIEEDGVDRFVEVAENLHGIADTLMKTARLLEHDARLKTTGGHGRRARIEEQISKLLKQIS